MILDQFKSKIVEYTKSKNSEKLGVLRFFLAQVANKEIELRPQGVKLSDEHVYKVLKKLQKQNKETIEMCEKAGRAEALETAKKEEQVLAEFSEVFPAEMRQE